MSRTMIALTPLLALAAATAWADPSIEDLMERGHWKRARAQVEERAKSRSDDAETLRLRSQVELAFGRTSEALALAEKAVALDGQSAEVRYALAEACGALAQRSSALKQLSMAKRFRKEAEAALALDPSHVEARLGLIEFYSLAPGIVGGSDKKAHALADSLTRLDPARGYLAQVSLAFREKKPERAEALYQKAFAADSGSYRVRMAMAQFFASETRKQWDRAEQQARAAIAIDPARAGGYSVLAGLYAHLERWSDLDLVLAEAERQVPEDLGPRYQAARILLIDGRELARAEAYLRRYLSQEPEGNAPTLAHAHWRLALVLEKLSRKPEAIAELEAALKINPDLEPAKKDLKRLKKG